MDRPRPETDRAGTDPTQPTPPLALALAPVSAQSTALVLPGGWQIEGLPAHHPARRAAGRGADRGVFHGQIRNPHTRAALLERSPQALDKHGVHPAALAVHRDANASLLEHVGVSRAEQN